MIGQEYIYQKLQEEDWKELIEVFYKRKDIIKSDNLLLQSLDVTINVIVEKALNLNNDIDFIESIEQFLLLNAGNFISLNGEQIEAIKIALVNAKKNNLPYAYNYAKDYPENIICKPIIEQFEKDFPKEFAHNQNHILKVVENKEIHETNDFRKSLFNSNQEVEFYIALKRVFDTYQVYPNVALSAVISYENIKDSLTAAEKDFFFKTSVDFVVLEPFRNYFPIYFFEVDSVWHDEALQMEKDKMKDKIFSIAGQKLYRIRKIHNSINETEFEKLLIEIRNSVS